MPVHCEQRDNQWRLIEPDGSIATTESGTARDGGGHDTEEQCNAQARAINDERESGEAISMAQQVNKASERQAKSWIRSGRVNKTADWSFEASDGNKLLGGSPTGDDDSDLNWDRYESAHLGIDPEESAQTKERYSYPVAKLVGNDDTPTVFRSGVIAAKQRAAQTDDSQIEAAADRLLNEIDEDSKQDGQRSRMRYPQVAQRLFNQPHAIRFEKLQTILHAVQDRMGIEADEGLKMERHGRQQRLFDYDVREGVAVLPIHGTLVQRGSSMDSLSGLVGYDRLISSIEAAEQDAAVNAILLDIDSGGGEMAGAIPAADHIQAIAQRIPMAALANEQTASAAYLLAASTGRIWATPGAAVGSIGVIMAHVDETAAQAEAGIKVTELFAGPRKADGSPHHALGEDEQTRLQALVDQSYDLLVGRIAAFRPNLTERLIRQNESGLFMGEERQEWGLIDGVHDLASAVRALASESSPEKQALLAKNGKTRTRKTKGSKRMAKGQCRLRAGENLASMLNEAIEEQTSEDRSSQDVQDDMAEAAGIDPSTVDGILNAGINCPPRERLEGFAEVLDRSVEQMIEAAESDGCDYSQGEEMSKKMPKRRAKAAEPAAVVDLCTQAGVPELASSLIREGATMEQARERVHSVGLMQERCRAAVSSRLVSEAKANELHEAALKAGKGPDQLSTDLLNAAFQSQSPDSAVYSQISPDSPSPVETQAQGWEGAFQSIR